MIATTVEPTTKATTTTQTQVIVVPTTLSEVPGDETDAGDEGEDGTNDGNPEDGTNDGDRNFTGVSTTMAAIIITTPDSVGGPTTTVFVIAEVQVKNGNNKNRLFSFNHNMWHFNICFFPANTWSAWNGWNTRTYWP